MTDETLPGPVDFILIEFPAGASTASTAEAMTDLLAAGIVRLYDVVLIRKGGDGGSHRVDLGSATDGDSREFAAFAGAQSGLFDDTDVRKAADALEPDTTGLLIAFENAWASPFVTAAHGAGGQVVASDRIPAQVLIEALEEVESAL
jgi:hypothetical protein